MRGERVGQPQEHGRIFWQLEPRFRGVGTVIEADADHLARVRNRRQKLDIGKRQSAVKALRRPCSRHDRFGGDRIAQTSGAAGRCKINDALARNKSKRRPAAAGETRDVHGIDARKRGETDFLRDAVPDAPLTSRGAESPKADHTPMNIYAQTIQRNC